MDEQSKAMAEFITGQILRDPNLQLTEDMALVSSGLMDSLALVDVLVKLEQIVNVRIPVGKVQPKDLDTIRQMLLTAKRVGKPRN